MKKREGSDALGIRADSPGVHGKDLTGAHEYFLTEIHLPGEPVQEQVYPEILQPMGRHTEDR